MSSDVRFPPSGISIESIQKDAEKTLGIKITLSGSTDNKITQLRQAIGSVEAKKHNEQDVKNLMSRVRVLAGDKLDKADLERAFRPELQKFIDVFEKYGLHAKEISDHLKKFDLKDNKIPITGDLDKDIQQVEAIMDKINNTSITWIGRGLSPEMAQFGQRYVTMPDSFIYFLDTFNAAKKASESQESKSDYKDSKK